ncbi:MAG TPA: hypothetical protein VF944_07290, partial [Candidatus Bathyarchaeia archaeon]
MSADASRGKLAQKGRGDVSSSFLLNHPFRHATATTPTSPASVAAVPMVGPWVDNQDSFTSKLLIPDAS